MHWKGVRDQEHGHLLSGIVWKWAMDPCTDWEKLIEIHEANPNWKHAEYGCSRIPVVVRAHMAIKITKPLKMPQ